MSRLDSFIRRVTAQRDCLNAAAEMLADRPGPVLELGLGNGRTYDHLRDLFPDREIFVFDRQVAAHPECIPDEDHMLVGELSDTLPTAAARFEGSAALVHADVGTGDGAANAQLAAFFGPLALRALAPGGLALTDQRIPVDGWEEVAPPASVPSGRYFIYRKPDPAAGQEPGNG